MLERILGLTGKAFVRIKTFIVKRGPFVRIKPFIVKAFVRIKTFVVKAFVRINKMERPLFELKHLS